MPVQRKLSVPSLKRNRTSGKHSRNGCGTCRVKCDETKPICRRCQNFKITCDGYGRGREGYPMQMISPGDLLIAPKLVMAPSIPSSPANMMDSNEEDQRYFVLFRDQLSFEINPFTEDSSTSFRTLVLQSSDIPSIRLTVIALAALGKSYQVLQEPRPHLPMPSDRPDVMAHREYSLRRYEKGLAMIKHAVATGSQDLRTTLLTCLLIICIECLHENYAMAGTLVANGMALMRDWRNSYPDAHSHPLGFSSPAPHVIEDSLVHLFGGLELQCFAFSDKASRREHREASEEGVENLRSMPLRFNSINDSGVYLALIVRRLKHWIYSLGPFFWPLLLIDDEPDNATALSLSSGSYDSDASSAYNIDDAEQGADNTSRDDRQALYLFELQQWRSSLDTLIEHSPNVASSPHVKGQMLVFKDCTLILNTMLAGDEMVFDDYTEEMIDILNLTEEVITALKEQRTDTKFTIFQAAVNGALFVGLHCRVSSVRRRAIELLQVLPRTKALSDSLFLSKVVEWVIELEKKEMLDGKIPGYARIRTVGVSINVCEKWAKMACTHHVLTIDGLVERVERMMTSY